MEQFGLELKQSVEKIERATCRGKLLVWNRARKLQSFVLFTICLGFAAAGSSSASTTSGIAVHGLRTNDAVTPIAIETDTPDLSWKLASPARAKSQSAYRVIVGETVERVTKKKTLLWDSGRVLSSSISMKYAGPALADLHSYYWAVQAWDEKAHASSWSAPTSFMIGPRTEADWSHAQWIAGRPWAGPDNSAAPPAPELRREFVVRKRVRSARLDVTGLGYYELLCDGAKLDHRVLAPGWTAYDKHVLYDSYDVTAELQPGSHALGVTLGRGFYANAGGVIGFLGSGPWSSRDPKFKLSLQIVYADGTTASIVSDSSWQTHDGPTVANFAYQGETYDAREETPGWSTYGYRAKGWTQARVTEAPAGKLVASILDPIRSSATDAADELKEIKPGVWRFAFPVVKTGWVQLHVRGPAGTRVTMKYAEQVNADGTVNNHGDPGITPEDIQIDSYILKGDSAGEIWEPRFSFKSFAYVQVEGFPGVPTRDSLAMRVVHTDLAIDGTFECSNHLLNEIQSMLLRSVLSNLQSIPSDTPMYEKRGWLGDAQVMAGTAIQNFDMRRFYRSWMRTIADNQTSNGSIPVLSPVTSFEPTSKYQDNVWSSAFLIIPWQMYLDYGDKESLADHYTEMARYVDFVSHETKNGILGGAYGDWTAPTGRFDSDVEVTETAYLYRDALLLAQIAKLTGHDADIRHWDDLASKTLQRFNEVFLNQTRGAYYNTGVTDYHQAANAVPLAFGMVPAAFRSRVAENLATDVIKRGNHLNTGIVGTKELLKVLSTSGHPELAFAIATQTTQPSWGNMLAVTKGRTGLWESWGSDTRSRNHQMYGSIGDWLYKNLAGISPQAPSYSEIMINPDYTAGLEWAKATRTVAAGTASSSWKRVGDSYMVDVSIPVNSRAEVSIPVRADQTVLEGGRSALHAEGVTLLTKENGRNVYKVGSGSYSFATTNVAH